MVQRTTTSHGVTYREHVDLDTYEKGTDGPYEHWEGDHTALVHVLWGAKHDGLIAERPSHRLPLERALFDRLFGESATRRKRADLIADLRAILDTFDPEITEGAPGASPVEDLTDEQRNERMASDAVASMILRSRWHAADRHYAIERAQREQATSTQR